MLYRKGKLVILDIHWYIFTVVSLLMSCVFTDDKWGDVPTYSTRDQREHELP